MPRFGLLRGREFIMKDAYSFHADEESLDETYQKMVEAYKNILTRLDLDYRVVHADSGAIGGSSSHGFMVLSDTGRYYCLFRFLGLVRKYRKSRNCYNV